VKQERSLLCLWLGEHERGIKRGSKGERLPGSFGARHGACLDKAGARKDRGTEDQGRAEGIEREGTRLAKSIFRLLDMVERSTC
jgi:hypothetical protein